MQLQQLTDLMDYQDDGITVDQLLLDKIVTGLNNVHLRQKLYKEGKDLTMEKALCIIRIYAAKHKGQGMTENYLKGMGRGHGKGKAQPNSNKKRAFKWARPRTKTAGTSMEKVEKEPISKDRNAWQLIRSVDSARNGTLQGGM